MSQSYLLDTHALIWILVSPEKLSKKVIEILNDDETTVYISAINIWEITLKASIGKLDIMGISIDEFVENIYKLNIEIIDLSHEVTASFHQLISTHHKDPFDRILIWTCIKEGFTLLSCDKQIQLYKSNGLNTEW